MAANRRAGEHVQSVAQLPTVIDEELLRTASNYCELLQTALNISYQIFVYSVQVATMRSTGHHSNDLSESKCKSCSVRAYNANTPHGV